MASVGMLHGSVGEAMRDATDHQRAGRLEQAERIYRAVLAEDPAHATAAYKLALIWVRTGRAREALPILKAAFDADRENEAALINYAVALAGSGQAESARAVLVEARQRGHGGSAVDAALVQVERLLGSVDRAARGTGLNKYPGEPSVPALNALADLFRAARHSELEAAAHRLAEQYPLSARIFHFLGASRLARRRDAEALEALLRASRLVAGDAGILNLLGVALYRLGRYEEARLHFEQSLASEPGNYDALVNASANAIAAGDSDGARRFAEMALAVRTDGVEAMLNLGNALIADGRGDEAAQLLRRAIALQPGSAVLYLNLGNVLVELGRDGEAVKVLQEALRLRPDHAPTHLNLGRALHNVGDAVSAQRHFRAASDLDPGLAEAHSAYLFALAHDATVSPQRAFEEHVRVGELLEAPHRNAWREHANDRSPERELRLGFVSGDLREHPVANLVEPIWHALRARRNCIIAYSNGGSVDAVQARLRALVHEWVQVERMNDDVFAERIRQDRIDILFDLSGHTARNRLPVFARRPAPVQVSWIGYPGTTGLSAMDYRFVRGFRAGNDAMTALFSEKLVHFGARGFEPVSDAPQVNALPALEKGYVSFGGFARPSKLGEGVVDLWSRVLLAVPDCRLIIAGIDEEGARQRLQSAFVGRGVADHRLRIHPRLPMAQYLALHHDVDVILDTFPYSGGTTTFHAAWMGVPVLTLAGQSLQQNQSAALLDALGLSNWVVRSKEEFVRHACRAAADLPALSRLRAGLRAAAERSFRGATAQTAEELELALRTIWRRWCEGDEPTSFSVQT